MGRLVSVVEPSAEPLTLEEVKAHLRIDHDDDDALLTGFIETARLHLDGVDGLLGRALMPQTWNLVMDFFPLHLWRPFPMHLSAIQVPLPPLLAVNSITYIDPDGVEQTFAVEKYIVDTASEPGLIYLAPGEVWPVTRCIPNAVTIEFECGYFLDVDQETILVPRPIRTALLGLIADYYEHREADGPTPKWVQALLAPYKVRM